MKERHNNCSRSVVMSFFERPFASSRAGQLSGLLLLALAGGASTSSALAEAAQEGDAHAVESSSRLVVLHRGDTDADADLRAKIDRQVMESLDTHVRIGRAYASPVPSEEVELAAGCTSRDIDCLQRIAATLEADWLMVRELAKNEHGGLFLTLVAHDGPSAVVTRRAAAQVSDETVERVVPMLIERLYPTPLGANDDRAPRSRSRTPLAVVGWSATAVTAGLLATGAVMGMLSRRSQDEYVRHEIDFMRDNVDRAADLHSRAEKRANVANGLFYASAGTALVATGALLWNYLQPREEARPVQVGVAPARDGAALAIHGEWRGGL